MTRHLLLALSLSGCAWLGADDRAAFEDRDGDGVRWDRDCDDFDPTVVGNSDFYTDADGDGWGDPAAPAQACALGPGLSLDRRDCDDDDDEVRPDASERCGAGGPVKDEDCDGFADDLDPEGALGARDWFTDGDDDGYGAGESVHRCEAPPGRVDNDDDCIDDDPTVHPGAGERCGPLDDDCDFRIDAADDDLIDITTWFADRDDDGQGDAADGYPSCDPVDGRVTNDDDCNDHDDAIYVGAPEIWHDGVDSDCDGRSDDDTDRDDFIDVDYGGTDCDDSDASIYPGAPEIWHDGVDQACDGDLDDDDADADGFDDDAYGGTDCDDTEATTFPGAEEFLDGVDSNCDGKDGVCGAVTRRVPYDVDTVEAAITAACPGDVVAVSPGTYAVNLTVDKAITLKGAGARFVPADPTQVVITAGRGRFLDFTVADGTVGGMVVRSGTNVHIEGVSFVHNTGTLARGGGLDVDKSPLTQVIDCTFEDNRADYGGGLQIQLSDDTLVRGGSFIGNTADTKGGGLFVNANARTLVDDCVFEANFTSGDGGGAYLEDIDALIQNSRFAANEARHDGGGLYNRGLRTVLRGLEVDGNTSAYGSAGIREAGNDALIEDCSITHNTAQGLTIGNGSVTTLRDLYLEGNVGHGLYVNQWDGGSWSLDGAMIVNNHPGLAATSSGALSHATFSGNTAQDGSAFTLGGETVHVTDVLVLDSAITSIWGNAAVLGGDHLTASGVEVRSSQLHGLAIVSDHAVLSEILVAGNLGDGLRVTTDDVASVRQITAVANGGAGARMVAGTGELRLANAVLAYNGVGIAGDAVKANDCDLFGNTTRTIGAPTIGGCLDVEPDFQTWGRRLAVETCDFHLAEGSPLRDLGNPAWLEADGTPADLGAYGGVADVLGSVAWYQDVDLDGMFDGWELEHGLRLGVDDSSWDEDGDSSNNGIEFATGTNPAAIDTDGDGRTDGQEASGGTDPLDPASP